jgi:hypothetical protein
MTENIKILSREELYNLVWTKPLTTLAKEFAYSDNGLRKICIKHNIPLPKSGYWSKVKFNKKVKKEKLSKIDNPAQIKLYLRQEGQESINHPNSERAKLKNEIGNNKELPLIVPDKLSKPDELIIKAREDLKGKEPSTWGTSEGLLSTSPGIINLQVSKSNISRALRFMDAFIKLIKKRGHSIKVSDGTIVIINEENLKIKIREYVKRKEINDNGWKRSGYKPSGELSFRIETYPEKIWRDGKKSQIEEKLTSILITLELKAKQNKERRLEHEAWQRNFRKQEEIKKALQEKKDKELEGFESLFHTATRWHKSQYIRNYIEEFKDYAIKSNSLDEEKKEWIEWAKEKADWYDPFIEKEVKLLEDVDRDTLKQKRRTYW